MQKYKNLLFSWRGVAIAAISVGIGAFFGLMTEQAFVAMQDCGLLHQDMRELLDAN